MFKIDIKNDKLFLSSVLLLAFISRMILAYFYISLPGEAYSTIPHDFVHYIDDAKVILEGKILYLEPTHTDGKPAPYGPLFMYMIAGILKIFGENYFILKIPAILADIGIITVLFYLTKNLFGPIVARYATIFYAFSLIPLLISGADATSDLPLVFFLITSIFFLTKKNPNIFLSATSLALSAGFKSPLFLIFLPVIAYYFIQERQYKKLFLYVILSTSIVVLMNFPFFIKAGTSIFIQLTTGLGQLSGTSFQSMINILVNFFIYGVDERTRLPNPLIDSLSFPILLTAAIIGSLYILKIGLKNKKIELIRNITLLLLILSVFVKMNNWHIFFWCIPFMLVLIFYKRNDVKKFQLSKLEIFGILLMIISSIIYAILYRWTKIPEYSFTEQIILFSSIVLSTIGTFFMMSKNEFKKLWSFSTFSWNLWLIDHAKLFMIFGFVIPILKSPVIAFGLQQFLSICLVVFSNLLLLLFLHKISKR